MIQCSLCDIRLWWFELFLSSIFATRFHSASFSSPHPFQFVSFPLIFSVWQTGACFFFSPFLWWLLWVAQLCQIWGVFWSKGWLLLNTTVTQLFNLLLHSQILQRCFHPQSTDLDFRSGCPTIPQFDSNTCDRRWQVDNNTTSLE